MMKLQNTSLIVIILFLFSSCGRVTPQDRLQAVDTTMTKSDTAIYSTKNPAKIDTSDVSFFQNATYSNMIEAESSKKILENTKNPKVVEFANMVMTNHQQLATGLSQLAKSKGYIVPVALPASKIEVVNKLTTMKQEGQNEYYVKLMVSEHDRSIALFSLASRSLDQDISNFAKKALPTLNFRYQTIVKLDSALAIPKVNQGDDLLKISNRTR